MLTTLTPPVTDPPAKPPRSSRRTIMMFGLLMFWVFFADSVMAYIAPVFIESRLHNVALMGLILSTSSVTGLVADVLIARFFGHKQYPFFVRWLLILAVLFPMLLFGLPAVPAVFLVAMAVWGVYYELTHYSQFNFIHETVQQYEHAHAWGMLDVFKGLALLLAPLVVSRLLDVGTSWVVSAVVISLALAASLLIFLQHRSRKHHHVPAPKHRSILLELKIWAVLMRRVWPVYIFFFSSTLLDTAFWTIGPLLSEHMKDSHIIGGLLLSAYVSPTLIVPLFAQRLGQRFGKKRTAFVTAIIGTSILAVGAFTLGESSWFLATVFVSAFFLSLMYPEIEAVFEDYLSRLHGVENDLVGLQSSAASLAFVVGPMLAGTLASVLGIEQAIGAFAVILGVVAFVMLLVTPRKIRVPQQAIQEVLNA